MAAFCPELSWYKSVPELLFTYIGQAVSGHQYQALGLSSVTACEDLENSSSGAKPGTERPVTVLAYHRYISFCLWPL